MLANRLLGVGDLEACGGVDYIASLPGKVGAPSHATHYAGIVTDNYRRRMIRELGIQAVQWSVSSTDPIDASIQHLSEALRAASDDATGGKFTGTTLAELDQVVFDDEFLIDGILTAEQPGICGALPKQFKTTQMVDMAISLATATPWLGHFPVRRPVRVAYMSGEGGRKFVQAVARRVCRSKGVPMPEDVIFEDRLPKMARPEDLIDLRRFLRREAVEVLFCDPVYLCMDGGEASNVMKQGEQLAPFNEVCQDCGVTPILVHHLRKSSESRFTLEPPELSDLAQAGFAEFAGQWWLLGREQRYDPAQPGSHRLWLSWGSRMGFGGKKGLAIEVGTYPESYWDVTVHDPSEIQEQRADATDQKRAERVRLKDEKDMQTVCNILAEFTDGETKAVIRNRGHFSGARVADLLDILVTEGHVEAFDGEKANQPCKLYRLPE